MNPALAGVALAVVLGAVVAASARNARSAILGLAVVLLFSPFATDPPAEPVAVAARLIGAVLAGYLLWIGSGPAGHGSVGQASSWSLPRRPPSAMAATGWVHRPSDQHSPRPPGSRSPRCR